MNPEFTIHATQYFTATIHEWQPVLADDRHKDIIMDSLQYLVNDKRIELNAFVIMSNHIHYNPVRAGLCNVPEEYYYSSAKFYDDGTNSFGMLKHY
jgi:REP element-mobilizing transposase RayT